MFLVRTFEVTSLQYGPGLRQAFADMSYDYHFMNASTQIGTGTSLVKKNDNGPALLQTFAWTMGSSSCGLHFISGCGLPVCLFWDACLLVDFIRHGHNCSDI